MRRDCLPHDRASPVYITCTALEFHTRLRNHTEYLLWVIYFLLSMTSQARPSLNLNQITIAFSTHHPLESSSPLLLVTVGVSILAARETKKHPHLEREKPFQLPFFSILMSPAKSWTPSPYLISSVQSQDSQPLALLVTSVASPACC